MFQTLTACPIFSIPSVSGTEYYYSEIADKDEL